MVERWWWVASRKPERLTIKVSGTITDDGLQGLPDLIGLAKEPEILVRIDCQGGRVAPARAVAGALRASPARVVARIEGMAHSAAVDLLLAACQVQAVADASLMIHAPSVERGGNAEALRAIAGMLDGLAREHAHALAAKCGRDVSEFLPLVLDGRDHEFSAVEARELGLVDVILSGALP